MAAPVIESERLREPGPNRLVPPLENGAHLSGREFLRRFEAMPELKKAELVNGIVYVGSPVPYDGHGKQDALIQTWLGSYSIVTPSIEHSINSTVRLDSDNVLQPDGLLRIPTENGGQSSLDAKGYLQDAPELVVEVAASSVSIDVREKLASYRRAGVQEYLVWRTQDEEINWWYLEEDEYHALTPDAGGILRSRVFCGLWLDAAALLSFDGGKVMATLQSGLASAEYQSFVSGLKKRG